MINQKYLWAEASKSAIIDKACTKTVAGEKLFKNYTSHLAEKARKEILTYPSNTSLKFGDGRKVQPVKRVVFQVLLAGKHCQVSAEIVVENMPRLLCKSSLEKSRTVLNMNDDKATIFDRKVTLYQSTSGHYCIDILPVFFSNGDKQEVLVLEADLSHKHKLNQLDKINKQFEHASVENVEKLVQNANLLNPELSSCTTCFKFKKPSQPIVGLSKEEDFNQTVSVDFDKLNPKLWYMHMVEEFTRYSAAAIISTKTITAKIFMKYWIAIVGAPKTVFSDNGGEFIGKSFVEICVQFNIKIKTALSENAWSKGLCKRQNQTLTSTLLKVKEDTRCDYDTALSWVFCAKNALINNNGFKN